MPLDADARRSWPPEPPEPGPPREPQPEPIDPTLQRLLADGLFKHCLLELLTAAFEDVTERPITPELFECVTARPEFRRQLAALVSAVLAEQQRGWRA